MAGIRPRYEYEATDTAVNPLPDDAAALHVLTRQEIDLTVLLTLDQLRQLRSQIDFLLTDGQPPSEPR